MHIKLKNLIIQDIQLTKLDDGVFKGTYARATNREQLTKLVIKSNRGNLISSPMKTAYYGSAAGFSQDIDVLQHVIDYFGNHNMTTVTIGQFGQYLLKHCQIEDCINWHTSTHPRLCLISPQVPLDTYAAKYDDRPDLLVNHFTASQRTPKPETLKIDGHQITNDFRQLLLTNCPLLGVYRHGQLCLKTCADFTTAIDSLITK